MESLVAYASSDEEEEEQQPSSSSSLFSALPQPQIPKSSSPFLSSLPPPKSSSSIPKRVVQIRLPVNPRPIDLDDEDDEEEEKARKKRKQMESAALHDSSVKSFLSAMPAPKSSQTLGALPSLGSGFARRSNLETETPAIDLKESATESYETAPGDNIYASYEQNPSGSSGYDASAYSVYEQNPSGYDASAYVGYEQNPDASAYVGYDASTWNGGGGFEATTRLPEAFVAMDSGARRGRRGKNEMPTEIVEVKQDELMKNRPRPDQSKATGIAFGPAYQPASSSSKGKVSKLHKRKHQITALFMDMKQKESELAERRSRGLLTKSETQAKYGW